MDIDETITLEGLKTYLSYERLSLVKIYDKIDSTNIELNRRIDEAENGSIVLGNEQTMGRGRNGRVFDSPKNKGIYFSYLFKPQKSLKEKISDEKDSLLWASLTSWSAVAVSRAIESTCGLRPKIKWVNDLFINGRKICGILTELIPSKDNSWVKGIIIGIGINVNQSYQDFPVEIRDTAGSIFTESKKKVSRIILVASLIKQMDEMIKAWPYERARFYNEYVRNSLLPGKIVSLSKDGICEEVLVKGIDKDFALIVTDKKGKEKRILSADISLKL